MKKVAIQAYSVSAKLSNTPVLHTVDVRFEAGRWVSIVGPNGAGKSTLLKVLAGVLLHTGEVQLFGQDMRQMAPRARAKTVAWLGQNEASADDLTVFDVVMLGRLPHQAWLATPKLGSGGAGRWVSYRVVSANVSCWRVRWRCNPMCC